MLDSKQVSTTVRTQGHRLSDALCGSAQPSATGLTPLPCNISAIEACNDFAKGRDYMVALVGPSGWGKSLLLRSISAWMTTEYGHQIPVWNAVDYLRLNPKAENLAPLILDDVQEATRQPRAKHELRTLLERRVKLRRPTLVSLTFWDSHLGSAVGIPFAEQWTLGTVREPQRDEKRVIIAEMAKLEGVNLSPELIGLMAAHLYGNGCSIAGALQCLKLVKLNWSYPEDIAKACGVLMSFLTLHAFDPFEEIWDAVQESAAKNRQFAPMSVEVGCFIMVAIAGFGEDKVANQLRIEPRAVYDNANSISRRLSDPAFFEFVEECKMCVLDRLSRF